MQAPLRVVLNRQQPIADQSESRGHVGIHHPAPVAPLLTELHEARPAKARSLTAWACAYSPLVGFLGMLG